MARIATDQETVLDAVVARLIRQMNDVFRAANCYQTVEPHPQFDVAHGLFCQVSPAEGRFDDPALAGGGAHTCFENAITDVTVFSRVRLDQPNRSEKVLKDASRGLLVLKRRILTALTGHDLQDADGNEILINLIAPVTATRPTFDPREHVASVSLAFSTDFEWNLQ